MVTLRLANLKALQDIGVAQSGQALGILDKALDEIGIASQLWGKHLEGDIAMAAGLMCQVHRSQTPLAKLFCQPVGTKHQGRLQGGRRNWSVADTIGGGRRPTGRKFSMPGIGLVWRFRRTRGFGVWL